MEERLVRIGLNLGPSALVEDLDSVDEVDLAPAQPLGQGTHDRALHRPGALERAMDERRGRKLGDELGQQALDRLEQLEQLAQARRRVVGGKELRKDIAPAQRS